MRRSLIVALAISAFGGTWANAQTVVVQQIGNVQLNVPLDLIGIPSVRKAGVLPMTAIAIAWNRIAEVGASKALSQATIVLDHRPFDGTRIAEAYGRFLKGPVEDCALSAQQTTAICLRDGQIRFVNICGKINHCTAYFPYHGQLAHVFHYSHHAASEAVEQAVALLNRLQKPVPEP